MPDFHFLRPEWFLAIIPLLILLLIQKRQSSLSGQWKNIVSPALQPYMLKHQASTNKSGFFKYTVFLTALLAITALAGPSWKKQPSQVFNSQSGLIIALDLSLSMTAQDVTPSRLQRAKYKILDILDLELGNNIALVAYAGDSHVASPLTRDIKTIQSMLPALDPYIMPKQGSNVRRLVDESIKLFEQGKSNPKSLLLVSDGVEESDIEYAATALKAAKIQLSILAVGTEEGAPLVQPDGRFFKDTQGQVIMPSLEWDNLKTLSDQSNGRIRTLSSNDSDIEYLTSFEAINEGFEETEESVVFDQWFDSGYWLIIPILLLSLLGFRKGIVLSLCLMFIQPEAVWAESKGISTSSLPDILLNDDQAAMKQFESDPMSAAEKFESKKWKASSFYKADNHEAALEHWNGFSDTESIYNQANTLAHLNRLDEALAAYDKVLETNPDHADAKHNKSIIEKMMEQQDSQQSDDKNSDQKDSDEGDSEKKDSDQQKQDGSESKNGEKSDQEQSSDGEQSEADQDQSSENPANQQEQSEKDGEQQSADKQNSDESESKEEAEAKQAQAGDPKQGDEEASDQEPMTAQQISKNAEQEQAMQQWMERIPDDPGGLLRNKFLYQYKNRNRNDQDGDRKPW